MDSNWRSYENLRRLSDDAYGWLKKRKVKGFYNPVTADNAQEGLRVLLETSGLGKLRPNIVILGFKNRWNQCNREELHEYFELIHECFDADMAVCVLRVPQGLDYSSQMLEFNMEGSKALRSVSSKQSVLKFVPSAYRGSFDAISSDPEGFREKRVVFETDFDKMSNGSSTSGTNLDLRVYDDFEQSKRAQEAMNLINRFRTKTKGGVVDVWWLFDDGGLAVLLPHLLVSHKSFIQGSKLRIFTTANNADLVTEEQKSMIGLLAKFRISCADVAVINNADHPPFGSTLAEWYQLIAPLKQKPNCNPCDEHSSVLISEDELIAMQDRTNRHLRTRELLIEHSKNSSLVVITLPVPRKNGVSAYLYLAWLEMLSNFTKSPVLLVRGNQQPVLTFYS